MYYDRSLSMNNPFDKITHQSIVDKMVTLARQKYKMPADKSDEEIHKIIDEKIMEKISSGEFKFETPNKEAINMALPTDTSARSSYQEHNNNKPRTSQLWSNFILRNLILTPINLIGAYRNDDLMTRGDIFVSTVLWPIEDIPKIYKRYKDKTKGIYQEPIENPKNTKNPAIRMWKKYGMTEGALRTTLPFLAFDAMALLLPSSKD